MRTKAKERTDKTAELMLKLDKGEIFDPMVLLPHFEVNADVYEAVDRFVEGRDGMREMKLTILSNGVEPVMQHSFRETFAEHYQDEYRKLSKHIRSFFIKILILVLISVPAILIWEHIQDGVVGVLVETLWGFSLWEVGYTLVDYISEWKLCRTILCIKNAKIEFINY